MDTKKLRQKILDLAIHGKLVPQDPNDEPASVLLERIRAEKEQLIKEGKIKAPKKSKTAGDTSHYGKEGPFELPKGWEWATLGGVAVDMADGPFGSNLKREHYTSNKEARIIQLSNIGETGWREDNTRYTSFSHAATISRSIVSPGNLVIAKMMPAGRAIICPDVEKMYVLSSDAVKYVPSKELFNKYLLYAINSSVVLNQIHAEVHGVTRARTSIEKLRGYCVPIPPKEEQYRIVRCVDYWLSIVFALEHNKTVVADSIELARTKILELAIKGKLVSQDPSDEPAIELLKRINPAFAPSDNLHYDDLPQNWVECRLSDVCIDFIVPQRDKPKLFDGEIPWCRIEDIEGKYLNGSLSNKLVTQSTIKKMNMRICPVGTVLCSCSASIGTQAIVTRPCCTNQTFIGLVCNDKVLYNEYLYYFLNSQTKQFIELGTGTTIKYISREKFEDYLIPLPPIKEQKRIVERIEYYKSILYIINQSLES